MQLGLSHSTLLTNSRCNLCIARSMPPLRLDSGNANSGLRTNKARLGRSPIEIRGACICSTKFRHSTHCRPFWLPHHTFTHVSPAKRDVAQMTNETCDRTDLHVGPVRSLSLSLSVSKSIHSRTRHTRDDDSTVNTNRLQSKSSSISHKPSRNHTINPHLEHARTLNQSITPSYASSPFLRTITP